MVLFAVARLFWIRYQAFLALSGQSTDSELLPVPRSLDPFINLGASGSAGAALSLASAGTLFLLKAYLSGDVQRINLTDEGNVEILTDGLLDKRRVFRPAEVAFVELLHPMSGRRTAFTIQIEMKAGYDEKLTFLDEANEALPQRVLRQLREALGVGGEPQ